MNLAAIKKSKLLFFSIILIMSFVVASIIFDDSPFSYLYGLMLVIVSLILILKQPWKWYVKIIILLSYVAFIFAIPMYLYSSTCTTAGYSYIDPLGLSISYPMFCGQAFTNSIFSGHYLFADLAILGWIFLFIRAVLSTMRKRGL